jgi:hypothetical protein
MTSIERAGIVFLISVLISRFNLVKYPTTRF